MVFPGCGQTTGGFRIADLDCGDVVRKLLRDLQCSLANSIPTLDWHNHCQRLCTGRFEVCRSFDLACDPQVMAMNRQEKHNQSGDDYQCDPGAFRELGDDNDQKRERCAGRA